MQFMILDMPFTSVATTILKNLFLNDAQNKFLLLIKNLYYSSQSMRERQLETILTKLCWKGEIN